MAIASARMTVTALSLLGMFVSKNSSPKSRMVVVVGKLSGISSRISSGRISGRTSSWISAVSAGTSALASSRLASATAGTSAVSRASSTASVRRVASSPRSVLGFSSSSFVPCCNDNCLRRLHHQIPQLQHTQSGTKMMTTAIVVDASAAVSLLFSGGGGVMLEAENKLPKLGR